VTWDSPDYQPTEKPLTLWDPREDEVAPTWSVSELGEALTAAVRRAFPDEVWVKGEIRNLSRSTSDRGTTVYFDLVEPAPRPQPAVVRLPRGLAQLRGGSQRLPLRPGPAACPGVRSTAR